MSKESAKKGCIKATRGPWTVHKTTSDGDTVTRYRMPSDQERHKNKQRERHRRAVAKKIFEGLRVYGNYNLPRKADSNHLLMALCEEAGWHVEADGAVFKKDRGSTMASAINSNSDQILRKVQVEDTQLVKENINGINLALSLTCSEK